LLIFFSLWLSYEPLLAQIIKPESVRIKDRVEEVKQDLAGWNFMSAVKKASALVERYPDKAELWFLYSETLIQSGLDHQAENALLQVIKIDSIHFPEAYRWISQRFFSQGFYDRASVYLENYVRLNPKGLSNRRDTVLQESIRFALDQIAKASFSQIKKLEGMVNSADDEYFPNLTADGNTLVFTRLMTSRQPHPDSLRQEDLCQALWDGASFSQPEPFSPPVGTPWNEGAQTLRQDGRIMIFTACNRPDTKGGCDLYLSLKTGSNWNIPINLGYPVNTRYWESTPCLSPDGRYLFFSSNRPGGYGGMDLWRSEKLKSGGWSDPVNLGKVINTSGDEMTPVCDADPTSLCFASNGHPGMGGFDLFRTQILPGGKWDRPENLGYPINTHANEDGLAIMGIRRMAILASDRDSVTGRDLYVIPWEASRPGFMDIVVEGRVTNRLNGAPVNGTIEIRSIGDSLYAKVESDPVTGKFQIALQTKSDYRLGVSAIGFMPYSGQIALPDDTLAGLIRRDVSLQPIAEGAVVVLENIYFKTDSYELLPESGPDLQSMYEFILSNPGYRYEIRGHTDSTGSPEHNKVLSQSRAEAVRTYLIDRGISGTRLTATGLGSLEPLENNATEEGRKRNRRTELKILDLK
jgi:outer membrane protein OmpA-like peptidoglycan-associated protein